ncbi:MAG TPA: hypothetical protein P5228_09400 [Bacteroidales bacterium]|nr:hypothetical protein [Bacteroidales bacterium]
MKKNLLTSAALLFCMLSASLMPEVNAWSEHPLLTGPALKNHPVWATAAPVRATHLRTFLLETEKELELFLAQHEAWSRANLPNYAPRPDALAFKATGNPDDIVERFYRAIRINPHTKAPLYLHLLPGDDSLGRPRAHPADLCTLTGLELMQFTHYVWLKDGEMVSPFDVLVTATDEPDYGLDLGLFADSNTPYGDVYGFGNQPFGNPKLEYSGQAPFHMAFYHEAGILYAAGPFLKRTWLDYRIFLFKALAEFAFHKSQDYWGWRFAGWGMHYVGDISQPYHMKPLPGVSTARMIRINLQSMMGAPKAVNNAVQLVSNRHAVMEVYQQLVSLEMHNGKNYEHPFYKALQNPAPLQPFSYDFILRTASGTSAAKGKATDKALAKYIPHHMVSDPSVEVSTLVTELMNLMQEIEKEKGPDAVDALTQVIAGHLRDYSMHINSYLNDVIRVKEAH